MNMDVYNCEECGHAFATESDIEPSGCPVCDGELFEFSNEAVLVAKIKRPLTPTCEKVQHRN